ncbi:hypothetical protein [Lacisediminimonas sp.]|uniref:hypothetical protein n=1 Tax=Lacisediminimonas sp. TaxID=3060582 RepID=UPI0027275837|nr:hypothetical protein [Lacisediminimonas sp.]MDO8299218.1 hypothetical protein [Lacisediminimonas sp.]
MAALQRPPVLARAGVYSRMYDLYHLTETPLTAHRLQFDATLRRQSCADREAVDNIVSQFWKNALVDWF